MSNILWLDDFRKMGYNRKQAEKLMDIDELLSGSVSELSKKMKQLNSRAKKLGFKKIEIEYHYGDVNYIIGDLSKI